MEMHSFKQLAALTPQELAALTRTEAPTVAAAPLGVGLGVDSDQFETHPIGDAAALAKRIVAAAKTARSGGPVLSVKLSDAAEKILAAGRRRRAEG
jgi:hypothetical protein